jgi:hypothetical protein
MHILLENLSSILIFSGFVLLDPQRPEISYRLEPSLRARSELCHRFFHLKFRRNIVVVFVVFKGVSVFRFVWNRLSISWIEKLNVYNYWKKSLKIHDFTPGFFCGFRVAYLFTFCVVLLCVFTFWVSCCDVLCNFRITRMFGSSLTPVQLRYLCLIAYSGAVVILSHLQIRFA